MNNILEELKKRKLIQDSSDDIGKALKKGNVFYIGADPTADSLHVGHLIVYFVAKLLERHGLKPILVIGGGTGKIGDPKPDAERELLPENRIKQNAKSIAKQAKKIVDNAKVINNDIWLSKINLISFLRDIGKHFTVNSLIKKEAIKARLEKNEGLSYTEFAYPLLQAYDFYQLFIRYKCILQVGGSDQWGNIVSGIDLIRKKENKKAYGFTIPLLIEPKTGKKFGKSEGNAIWLDKNKTSVFEFYQFFVNQTDEMAQELAYKFLINHSIKEIEDLIKQHKNNPSKRILQKKIAYEITQIVHSKKDAKNAQAVSEYLFYGEDIPNDKNARKMILGNTIVFKVKSEKSSKLSDILIQSKIVESKNKIRNLIKSGAIRVEKEVVRDINYNIKKQKNTSNLLRVFVGKKKVLVVSFER